MFVRDRLRHHRHTLIGTLVIAIIFLGLAAMVTPSKAASLRAPQVVFDPGPLQGYLNSLGETFDVTTAQADVQIWTANSIGPIANSDFTLALKNGVQDEIGVYNSADPLPTLFSVFPAGAVSGWHADMHFTTTALSVSLFDENNVYQGQTNYPGVNRNSFGFYIKSLNGTFYSQDARNGRAMVLAYAGVTNAGDWWLCFQDVAYPLPSSTFDSAVLEIQSVRPTPTTTMTFGRIKSLYR